MFYKLPWMILSIFRLDVCGVDWHWLCHSLNWFWQLISCQGWRKLLPSTLSSGSLPSCASASSSLLATTSQRPRIEMFLWWDIIIFKTLYNWITISHYQIEHKFLKLGKVIRASPWSTPCPSPSATSVRKLHFKSHLFTQ